MVEERGDGWAREAGGLGGLEGELAGLATTVNWARRRKAGRERTVALSGQVAGAREGQGG